LAALPVIHFLPTNTNLAHTEKQKADRQNSLQRQSALCFLQKGTVEKQG